MLYNGPLLGGRYKLGPILGHGGMSVVHRAHDLATDTDVAVKLFADGAGFDALVRQQREVVLSRAVAHPAIAAVLDYNNPGPSEDAEAGRDPAYLVCELVDGPTLRARISQSPLLPEQVATLGGRLAGALAYLHEHGIVHRDIKPANVLLTGTDDAALAAAKLADFGVAIRVDDTRVTVDGSVVGTATYLSPEQVSGGQITGASDVYALGLLLAECLTGRPSFTGSGVECALARLSRSPEFPADLPAGLVSLLTAMTARQPEDRPTAAEVETALRNGVADTPAVTAVLPELAGLAAAVAPVPVAASADQVTTVLPVVNDPAARRHRLVRRALLAGAGVAALLIAITLASGPGLSLHPLPASTPTTHPTVVVHIPTTSTSSSTHVQVVATTPSPAKKPTPTKAAPPPPPKKGPGHGRKHGGGDSQG